MRSSDRENQARRLNKKCIRNESEHENKVHLTTAKYNNMNSTHILYFLRHLIFRVLGYMGSEVKEGMNGSGVGLAWSCKQC